MANDAAGAKTKKKKKREASPAPVEEAASPAEEGEGEGADRAYKSAAVAFFTRKKSGEVAKVLVAAEERKIQASVLGLDKKGKVNTDVVVLPMGRREKKDKADCVETVKREYIEETTNYAGLAKYLDFADFDGDDEDAADRGPNEWTGKKNLALFFEPALMSVLFCEVPAAAATPESAAAALAASTAASSASSAAAEGAKDEPASKKQRKDAPDHKPSNNHHVGKQGHLQPYWIDAAELRKAVESSERAPVLHANGKELRVFPTIASALRQPEAREWLGLKAKATSPETSK